MKINKWSLRGGLLDGLQNKGGYTGKIKLFTGVHTTKTGGYTDG